MWLKSVELVYIITLHPCLPSRSGLRVTSPPLPSPLYLLSFPLFSSLLSFPSPLLLLSFSPPLLQVLEFVFVPFCFPPFCNLHSSDTWFFFAAATVQHQCPTHVLKVQYWKLRIVFHGEGAEVENETRRLIHAVVSRCESAGSRPRGGKDALWMTVLRRHGAVSLKLHGAKCALWDPGPLLSPDQTIIIFFADQARAGGGVSSQALFYFPLLFRLKR